MTTKKQSIKETDDSPFAGCVLHEMVKRGEWHDYSYPQNSLPKVTVKSAPAWSPILEAIERAKK